MTPAELYRADRPGAVARDAAQGEYLAMFARLAVDGEKVAAMTPRRIGDQAHPVKPAQHTHDAAYRWMLRTLKQARVDLVAARNT